MAQKPKSPEEVAAELKELLSEGRGMLRDLTRLLDECRREVPKLVSEQIVSEMRESLEKHAVSVREVNDSFDKLMVDKFADLEQSIIDCINRFAAADPNQFATQEEYRSMLGIVLSRGMADSKERRAKERERS